MSPIPLGILAASSPVAGGATGFDYLESVTVGATPQAAIEFTGLDSYASSYDTLFVSWVAKTNSTAYDDIMILTFNNDTSAIYDISRNFAYASSTSNTQEHYQNTNGIQIGGFSLRGTGGGTDSNAFSFGEFELPAFSSSSKKTAFGRASGMTGTYNETGYHMGLYDSTSPITSLKLTSYSAWSFTQHSEFVLYGKGK